MKYVCLGTAAFALLNVIGCAHTAEGAKVDLKEDSQKASVNLKKGMESASIAANEAKKKIEDMSDTASLTLKIKNSINADKDLNDSKNSIDVDTTKDAVTLSGHVYSETLKERAAKIAKEEMQKAKATQPLKMNLSVNP